MDDIRGSVRGDEMELVSIITPMYNASAYIAHTIAAVQKQTYTNWEMIIMDDLSEDNSAEIVKEYANKDERIRYYLAEQKCGVAEARNEAMKRANGRYIAFLDSDDLWKPEKLEKQLAFMKEKQSAFSFTACGVIDENGKNLNKVRHVPEEITYEQLLHGNVIPCLTVVIDKEQVGEFFMPQIGHEDYATWLTILKELNAAHGINETLGYYRVNRNSVSANKARAVRWTWNIYRKNQNISFVKSAYYLAGHILQAMKKRK